MLALRVAEKMMEWSDEQIPLPLEHILTNVSLYWFSGCYPTSQWCYRSTRRDGGVDTASWLADVRVPVGYSWFEKERAMAPKKWIDTLDKIKWYRTNEHVCQPTPTLHSHPPQNYIRKEKEKLQYFKIES